MTSIAIDAAQQLETEGIEAAVVNMHTIKPIDRDCILTMSKKCKGIVTAEEHSVIGGLGDAVADVLAEVGGVKMVKIGVEDKFGKSGKPADLFKVYGLTVENIVQKCKSLL